MYGRLIWTRQWTSLNTQQDTKMTAMWNSHCPSFKTSHTKLHAPVAEAGLKTILVTAQQLLKKHNFVSTWRQPEQREFVQKSVQTVPLVQRCS